MFISNIFILLFLVVIVSCNVASGAKPSSAIVLVEEDSPTVDKIPSRAGDRKSRRNEEEPKGTVPFVATAEWQEILPGHIVPPGLHYRMNLETGKKEAKLLDGQEPASSDAVKTHRYQKLAREKNPGFTDALGKVSNDPSKAQDADKVQHFRSMDEIKKQFKGNGMSVKSETEILKSFMKMYQERVDLANKNIDKVDKEKIALLNEMEYSLHNLDVARDFVTLHGIQLILPDLNSTNLNLRSAVAVALGTAMQNNPVVQQAALDSGVLAALLRTSTTDNMEVVIQKATFALSSLLRNNPEAQKAFVAHGGMEMFFDRVARHSSLKLKVKMVTLITDILMEGIDGPVVPANYDEPSKDVFLKAFHDNFFCRLIPTVIETPLDDTLTQSLTSMQQISEICKEYFESSRDRYKGRISALFDKNYDLYREYPDLFQWIKTFVNGTDHREL